MTAACVHDLHYLKDVQWGYHDCMTLGDKGYLGTEVQQNLFDVANMVMQKSSESGLRPFSPSSTTVL